jgi:hypothetical protein
MSKAFFRKRGFLIVPAAADEEPMDLVANEGAAAERLGRNTLGTTYYRSRPLHWRSELILVWATRIGS